MSIWTTQLATVLDGEKPKCLLKDMVALSNEYMNPWLQKLESKFAKKAPVNRSLQYKWEGWWNSPS